MPVGYLLAPIGAAVVSPVGEAYVNGPGNEYMEGLCDPPISTSCFPTFNLMVVSAGPPSEVCVVCVCIVLVPLWGKPPFTYSP